jgi:hypothetical protein
MTLHYFLVWPNNKKRLTQTKERIYKKQKQTRKKQQGNKHAAA